MTGQIEARAQGQDAQTIEDVLRIGNPLWWDVSDYTDHLSGILEVYDERIDSTKTELDLMRGSGGVYKTGQLIRKEKDIIRLMAERAELDRHIHAVRGILDHHSPLRKKVNHSSQGGGR